MILLIIFTIIGMAIGELAFYDSGWLIGGALGFLVTKIVQMSNKINSLEKVVHLLQQEKTSAEQKAPLSKPEPQNAAPETAAPNTQTPTQNIPLVERLKAHGIDLPPEAAPVNTANIQKNNEYPLPPVSVQTEVESSNSFAAPLQQSKPAQPNPVEKAVDYIRRFFTEGNPIVRIGMVVMFFGLSFLVKYASNQGLLPLELRMSAVAVIAIGLIGLGWKTRTREGGYGLVLQGGGIAALYLTVFAAAKMYSLMPGGFAFGLMFVVVILGAALAVMQNAQVLALMATAGGFLAPILTSDGTGNHVGLFSFYLLLNIGILAIAWFKTWRLLNWIGFVFTFIITSAWGVLKYEPHLYLSTQPFLLAFFALFLTVSILFSLKQPPNLKGMVDASLVFGLPIVGFGLQAALLKHTEYGLAISAIILSALYLLIARLLWAKYQQTHRVLIESFIALGVCFATLSIPLALDAQWTSAAWALEAAGLVWVGLRQARLLPRIAGYLLHFAGALSLIISGIEAGSTPILSGDFIGLMLLSISAFCIAFLINFYAGNCPHKSEQVLAVIAHTIGWLWWLIAGGMEIDAHISGEHQFTSMVIFFSLSVAFFLQISKKINWQMLSRVGYWLLPLTAFCALRNFGEGLFIGYAVYPSKGLGLLAIAIFIAVQYYFLWCCDRKTATGLTSVFHILSAWFLFSLGYWEALHWQQHFEWSGTGAAILWFSCLAIPLTALLYFSKKPVWPFTTYRSDYSNLIPAPLVILLLFWFLYVVRYSGATGQFYLPVLNPLDLAQMAVVLLFAYLIKRGFAGLHTMPAVIRYGLPGILLFTWLNVVLLRAVHQYADITYSTTTLWNSVVVQMSLSILWAICALVVMNISRRIGVRELWMVGAGLLGMVVVKLFIIDLTGTGTLARIVSFMVVGGLMLLIGYLSPIPAKPELQQEESV